MRPLIPIALVAFTSLASPAQVASNPAQVSEATVLRANANLVLVDVVVTDHENAVHGIDPKRFHVLEGGHEQAVTSFEEHKPAASPRSTPTGTTLRVTLPPHTYSNVPNYPPAGAVNVLLLDGLNTPIVSQMDVRRQMLQFMGKIEPGTSLAIFTLSSRLRMIEGFTTDPAQLLHALQDKKSGAQQSVILDPQSDQALDTSTGDMTSLTGNMDSISVAGTSALGSMLQFQADVTSFETDLRVGMTLDAMQQLGRYLSAIPGRKNLIWFSGSFPIALDPDDSLQSPFQAMRNYSDQIHETSELLSSARVAVYPVDARGLMTPVTADASYSPSTNLVGSTSNGGRGGKRRNATANRPSTSNDDLKFSKQLIQQQATMEQIAAETGGVAYLNTNGLKEAVASAVENGSSYYTLGYVPSAAQLDGKFHTIQIRVDNSNYKLACRSGYFADPPNKSSAGLSGSTSLVAAATLHGSPPSTEVLFQARVLAATDPAFQGTKFSEAPAGEMSASLKAPIQRAIVDLTVDAHGVAFDEIPDGAHQARLEFVLVAYDPDGKRLNYFDRGFAMKVLPGQFTQTMTNGLRVRLALDLPAGQDFLRIAVHDLAADRAGSLEVPVSVASK